MKNLIFACFLVVMVLGACKKKDPEPVLETFRGITETYQGKKIPLFEFSDPLTPQKVLYNAIISYQTGTVMIKMNYQLSYTANQILSNAQITNSPLGTPISIDYTINAKNQITHTNAYGNRPNITYAYDQYNRLISSTADGFSSEYEYDIQGRLNKITLKNQLGKKWLEVLVTCDDKINPLKKLPLAYLEDDMPMWTWFSLSKHNITSLTYNDYNPSGSVTGTEKYVYTYSYDQDGKPLTMKRYYYPEFLKGDKGYYNEFIYNY
ncbi:RHS repeat domain-containing protein [Pedobacter sp. Hv1]|uniref:RHS repeat domain-containing protein n=1 Tax=Pedobacter sp. Hv1 TaxID=1740090 RepID=UPI0006D8C0C7|nr:RHS repeat domain-containing protein [Pedobacter sp. Hv1]KQC00261.1 hypothetical protein AQF98_12230 [Pedobacter sp. Hv1]